MIDWKSLKINEISYFCHSFKVDFDCLPIPTQIEFIICILYYYDIHLFEIQDIVNFYKTFLLVSPRSGRILSPVRKKIQEKIEKILNGQYDIVHSQLQVINPEQYQIDSSETHWYADEILWGYQHDRIKTVRS